MAAANVANDASPDLNVEDIIAQVLEKQQSVLESVVHNAVKGALTEIDTSLQHIRTELEMQVTHKGREFTFTTAKDADVFCQELDMEDDTTCTQDTPQLDRVPMLESEDDDTSTQKISHLEQEPTAEPEQADPPTTD
ncbi:exocyst complex component 1-like [Scomber scombrus]|uniref:Exocyst complex component 1-like n=1 Tax=Scomber scombrus TaxID=13677 RepID=A0AAV1N7E0_SCOSC